MSLSRVPFVSMVPHPSSAIPIDTFIGRGRHLRGSPVKKNLYREWAGLARAGKGRAGHVCDHLVIEMKNKGYKPGPASSFFQALCASQVGLGIGSDIGGSFGGGFSAENFRAPWDQTKKTPTALWHPLRKQNVSQKNKSGGESVC